MVTIIFEQLSYSKNSLLYWIALYILQFCHIYNQREYPKILGSCDPVPYAGGIGRPLRVKFSHLGQTVWPLRPKSVICFRKLRLWRRWLTHIKTFLSPSLVITQIMVAMSYRVGVRREP